MKAKTTLTCVEIEYMRLLKDELNIALRKGEPERAAAFSKELAKLRRKEIRLNGGVND
jgi:hypothetical protein